MSSNGNKWEATMPAAVSNIPVLVDSINGLLEQADCPMKAQMQIDVALDEILANIANYAYGSGSGDMTIAYEFTEATRTVVLRFTDAGIPYDPLTAKEPDTSLSADDRPIGGLGIFLVRKTMDGMSYERKDGMNVLTIRKII